MAEMDKHREFLDVPRHRAGEETMDQMTLRSGAAGDRLAGRLLRLPHVVPRPGRVADRPRRARSTSSTARSWTSRSSPRTWTSRWSRGRSPTRTTCARSALIRERTRVLVSFGDCAVTGNVTALRNPLGDAESVLQRGLPRDGDLAPALPGEPRASCRRCSTACCPCTRSCRWTSTSRLPAVGRPHLVAS